MELKMLVQLTPENISDYWDLIKYAIENSLPPIAENKATRSNNILESLLIGEGQCWVSYAELPDGGTAIDTVLVTKVSEDTMSGTKSLLIYCLFGFQRITGKAWAEGYVHLSKFARSRGCFRIVAYTDLDHIKKVTEKLGGDTSYTFLSFPLFNGGEG